MSELDVLDNQGGDNTPANVPYAVGALVLGIISIVTCWLYGIPGVICGIIALILHAKDKKVYLTNPAKYEQSFKTSKAGFICGIVGLSLSALFLIYLIVVFMFFAAAIGSIGAMR